MRELPRRLYQTTMNVIKINAETLSAAGWTDEQIDRYYTLLSRKQTRDLGALSPEGRRFMQSARTAVEAYEKARLADLTAAARRKATGVNPVETKLHYRWTQTEAALVPQFVELAPGEVSALQIIKDEICQALSKYQPVLDQVDTSKRGKFDRPIALMLQEAEAMSGARYAQFDLTGYTETLKVEFEDKWNDAWDAHYGMMAAGSIVFADSDEFEYRRFVRPQIELLTRDVYPSVTAGAA